jgi:uncharacterized protein YjdB
MAIAFDFGQSDLELYAADSRVYLSPFNGTSPLTSLEDTAAGGIDNTKIGGSTKLQSVGNYEKKAGVKLSNKPTINKIMSAGHGSPTAYLPSEAEKGITYDPQQVTLRNLQLAWGFTPSAVSTVSSKGGFTIAIPELPAMSQWRCAVLAQQTYNGKDVFMYWIANKAIVSDRNDVDLVDSDVIKHGVSLGFVTDPAVGVPVIFGMCGAGLPDLVAATADGSLYPATTGITVLPTTKALTVAAGANHTQQLAVSDSNLVDRTAVATYVSSDVTKVTVSTTGLMTGVATGTGVTVTASYMGFTAVCTNSITSPPIAPEPPCSMQGVSGATSLLRKAVMAGKRLKLVMSERLMKLHVDTNCPEPYEVADGVFVKPPGRKRREAMNAAEMRIYVASSLLNEAANRNIPPAPPEPKKAVEQNAVAEWQAAKDEWDLQVKATEAEMNQFSEQITTARADYDKAFFGDAYDTVIELFDDEDLPVQLWDEFVTDIKSEFLPSGKQLPDDGTCPECGQVVDEEQAGKAQTS